MDARSSAGLSLIETLVSLMLLMTVMSIMAVLLVENSRVNKEQHRTVNVQSSARTALSVVSQVIRSAGWDPTGAGVGLVTLDDDPSDGVENLDVFADLNGDGDVADSGESVRIRHIDDRIEWRLMPLGAFETIATNITNDADGDGTVEPMFVPDASPDPTRLTIRITAGLPPAGPGGRPIRYTVTSDVILRNAP